MNRCRDFNRSRVALPIAAATLATIFAAVTGGCGLPQFILLDPPTDFQVFALDASVTFFNNPENDPDSFLGYELYYKFYAPATVDTQFAADLSAIGGAAAGSMPGIVTQRGFRRVLGVGQGTSSPLIRISATDRSSSFPITVLIDTNLAQLSAGVVTWDPPTGPPVTITLLRNLVTPKVFRPDTYVTSGPGRDADIPAGDYSTKDLPMALVVVAYGVDFTTFQPLYSQPVMASPHLRLVVE
ncbi:MAG: hypothetical protein EA382_11875 [Spirochaetaceae bacterium]|nr:MAG: hypothetical protein EA382_11875 [Spirochaetaceae bacterium]